MKFTIKKTAVLIFIAVFGVTGFVFADNPAKRVQGPDITKPELSIDPKKLKLRTDLSVYHIHSNSCLCTEDLSNVDAFLMNGMWVDIRNAACPDTNTQANASGRLRVSYFDMLQGRMVNRLVPFTVNMNGTKSIKAVSGYVLVKKSIGIKAEIHRIDAPVKDCNSGNDSLAVKRCLPDIVQ